MRVDIADGKYTYIFENGCTSALRYGQPWERDVVGDKFIYCMASEIETLRQSLALAESSERLAHDAFAMQVTRADGLEKQLTEKVLLNNQLADLLGETEQHLSIAQADSKTAWEKAGEACTAHANSINRELRLRKLVGEIYCSDESGMDIMRKIENMLSTIANPEDITSTAFEDWHKAHAKYIEPADIVHWCKDAYEAGHTSRNAEIEKWKTAEHKLSDAYLRLRALLEAFDTPAGVTAEQVWEHTEDKLKELIAIASHESDCAEAYKAEADQLRKQVNIASDYLKKLACLGNGDRHGNSVGNCLAIEALFAMESK